MRYISKVILAILLVLPFSCEMLNFKDKLDNPNAATPESASADLLFNSIQLSYARFHNSANRIASQMMRMEAMTWGYTYDAAFGSSAGNTLWTIAYSEIFPDYDAMVAIAEPAELRAHLGAAKVIKAMTLMQLVDFFGAVPYGEIGQGISNKSPQITETDQELYTIASDLLKEAINDLDPNKVSRGFPETDLFYGSGDNRAKWIMAANSLLMRMSLNTGDMTTFDAAAANAIVSSTDDFDFHYGTNRNNPNSRHPQYNNQYETSDGIYQSNYLMWVMRGIGDGGETDPDKTVADPRIRYYFYRQDASAADEDQFTIDCPYQPRPNHFSARDPFCLPTNQPNPQDHHDGYWGRDHGNAEGIPPDGHLRTVYGAYPAGGNFDDNSFKNTKTEGTQGGLGAGIWPIMDASFVHFMMAERNIANTASARTHLEMAVRASIDKVMDFGSNLGVVDPAYEPTSADVDAYVADVLANFDAATNDDERLDVVAKEFHIAAFGNGMEIWALYRRTGKPTGLQPTREPEQGTFPRTLLYPSIYVDLNQNAQQKASIGEKVFWDKAGDLN